MGRLPWDAESGLSGEEAGRKAGRHSQPHAAEVAERHVYLSRHIFPSLVKASSDLPGPATGNRGLHRPEHGRPRAGGLRLAGGLLTARSRPLPAPSGLQDGSRRGSFQACQSRRPMSHGAYESLWLIHGYLLFMNTYTLNNRCVSEVHIYLGALCFIRQLCLRNVFLATLGCLKSVKTLF